VICLGPNKAFLVPESCKVTERNDNSINNYYNDTCFRQFDVQLIFKSRPLKEKTPKGFHKLKEKLMKKYNKNVRLVIGKIS
jgi:hypothetical protein